MNGPAHHKATEVYTNCMFTCALPRYGIGFIKTVNTKVRFVFTSSKMPYCWIVLLHEEQPFHDLH